MIAEVALNIPLRQVFDYRIPESAESTLRPGVRVIVPFGARTRSGIVTAIKEKSQLPHSQLKSIAQIPEHTELFSVEMLEFTKWLAGYYFCAWGEVLDAAIPTGMGVRFSARYRLREPQTPESKVFAGLSPRAREFLNSLNSQKSAAEWDAKSWRAAVAGAEDWDWLSAQLRPGGAIATRLEYAGTRNKPSMERWVRVLNAPPPPKKRRNPLRETRRERVLRMLREEGELPMARLRSVISDPGSVVRKLAAEDIVEIFQRRVERRPYESRSGDAENFLELNDRQQEAFDTIHDALVAHTYAAFLLEGVTGSGKTEVYLHAVRETLALGRSVLVLVPEIALTAAIVGRFRSRFGDEVAVLHSGLSEGERFDEWSRIHGKQAHIVIGARSAVFAPVENLGLVVIDEEHDPSFKQDETPRYHGRDAALLRALRNNAVAVLGSATPSLEATHNVAQGKFTRLELPHRISRRPLPKVTILGMRHTPRQPGSFMFSRQLVEALRETLLRGDQSILFLNRRGYAQLARCSDCEAPMLCVHCSISLTYHHVERRMQCHRCEYSCAFPERCPECNARAMEKIGIGTERIEQEVGMIFPDARVLRVDSDTLRRRGELERMLRGIEQREYDIVIGTQILSKGHDFPHITLVGAVLADVSLNLPDFRASERTFQILTQLAGRAGRGERPGQVLVQTYSADHYSLTHVAEHDSSGFSAEEMAVRRDTGSPPLSSQILIWCSSPEYVRARALAEQVAGKFRRVAPPEAVVMGPAEAPIGKLHNRYRWMVMLRGPTIGIIHPMLHKVLDNPGIKPGGKDRIAVDVDPYNLL